MSQESTPVMIEADGLTKRYGPHKAIQNISFNCRQGEIVGFLGPNGAGKTTTMRILTGYMPPTAGDAYIAGFHTVDQSLEARRRLGYMPETVPLYPEMTVEGYLAFMGRVRRLENLWEHIDQVLQEVALLDRAESFIGSLSKGMRQRVGLAQALLHDPDVLILDEPTIGLDPAQIVDIRELISELGEKRTILLSTHILAEVEQICSRAIIIINGRIWSDMTMDEIRVGRHAISLTLAQPAADTQQLLREIEGVEEVSRPTDGKFSLITDSRDETRIRIAETAVHHQWGLLEMAQASINLETLFLDKLKEAEATGHADPEAFEAEWEHLEDGALEEEE
ncbi:MAG: ABC transporter ATP-binding protein [Anaerolineae bacterium]